LIARSIRHRSEIGLLDTRALESNVFFLANNVTLVVKSPSPVFIKACASQEYAKVERPTMVLVVSTLFFLMGVGEAELNAKTAYHVGHGIQGGKT
jgi:hypothetical protein